MSSQAPADDREHHVAPIEIPDGVDADEVMAAVVRVLEAQPRTSIEERDAGYVHAVARSKVFRFADDVEFLLAADGGRLDVRSASRVGHSDLGVNRKRVESLREALGAEL